MRPHKHIHKPMLSFLARRCANRRSPCFLPEPGPALRSHPRQTCETHCFDVAPRRCVLRVVCCPFLVQRLQIAENSDTKWSEIAHFCIAEREIVQDHVMSHRGIAALHVLMRSLEFSFVANDPKTHPLGPFGPPPPRCPLGLRARRHRSREHLSLPLDFGFQPGHKGCLGPPVAPIGNKNIHEDGQWAFLTLLR